MATSEGDDAAAEIRRLLAAAPADGDRIAGLERRDALHVAEMDRRDQAHVAETERRDTLHLNEMQRRQDVYDHELDLIRTALETRDIIGQAKGVVIATLGCSSDEAFVLLRKQSQSENRKLHEVAAEIVTNAQRRRS